jgi:hypothetical protein
MINKVVIRTGSPALDAKSIDPGFVASCRNFPVEFESILNYITDNAFIFKWRFVDDVSVISMPSHNSQSAM